MDPDFSQGFTAAAWVWYDVTNNNSRIMDFGNGQASDNIVFANSGTTTDLIFKVYTGATSGGTITAAGVIETGKWMHLAATVDMNGNAKIYKDGAMLASGTTAVPASINRTQNWLGRSNWAGDSYFDGRLKDFEMWNYALNEDEIVQSMMDAHYDPIEDNVALIRDGLLANLQSIVLPATVMNTVRLEHYMQTEIEMYDPSSGAVLWHPFGQVLLTSDLLPDAIWEGSQNGSVVEQYLEQGGKMVWPGGYPAFSIHTTKAEYPDWATGNYVGIGLDYEGALGHQFIFDINTANNRGNSFGTGLIAYSDGEYHDDDYDADYDYATQTYNSNDNVIDAFTQSGGNWHQDTSGNYDDIKYDIVAAQHPAFTQAIWAGLDAHVILGKHEFDSEWYRDGVGGGTNKWDVYDLDGYSRGVSQKDPTTGYGILNVQDEFRDEIGTDPMDMGLWFKPYLADTNGAIEEDLIDANTANWYAQDELTGDPVPDSSNFYHHELWNVGSGSIQAGVDGRGIVSLLPMFPWDDFQHPITGTQVRKNGGPTTWYIDSTDDYYGVYSDRGSGGLMNSPSTRDLSRIKLGMSVGSMMVAMALDNIIINALRDNQTSGTNLLNPMWSDGNALDKYPYLDDNVLGLRNNASTGQNQYSPDHMNFPIWTGNYNKWMFANGFALRGDNAYVLEGPGGNFDSGDSILQLVYEGNNLITTLPVETGGQDGGGTPKQANPYTRPQYLSLENITYSGADSGDDGSALPSIISGVATSDWRNVGSQYGLEIIPSASGHHYSAGISSNTHIGAGGPNGIHEWSYYPQDTTNDSRSRPVQLSHDINSYSGFATSSGAMGDLLDDSFTTNLNREIILRHPIVNLFSNQAYYEAGIIDDISAPEWWDYTVTPRGRGDSGNSYNYGASMPWSIYSPLILNDGFSSDSINASFTAGSYGGQNLQWGEDGGSSYTFLPSYVLDGTAYDNSSPQAGGGSTPAGQPRQWLAADEYHILTLEANEAVSLDAIRISPALNSVFDFVGPSIGYLKVAPVKTLEVIISNTNDFPIGGDDILASYLVTLQKFQTTDIIIPVNPSGTVDDFMSVPAGGSITFRVVNSYDSSYAGFAGNTEDFDMTLPYLANSNSGGIGEIYLYGTPGTTYTPISTKLVPFNAPEDGRRYTDNLKPWMIDGGTYYQDDQENKGIRRGMNGGTYQISISTARNEPDIGSLRFMVDHGVLANVASTDFTPEFIAHWQAEIQKTQLAQLIFLLFTVLLSIILIAVTAGIGALAMGGVTLSAAVVVGAKAGFVATMAIGGIITTVQIAGIVSPTLGGFLGLLLQMEDIVAGALINLFCELLDLGTTWSFGLFNYLLTGEQIVSHRWRKKLQPLLYALYALFLDFNGTIPRQTAGAFMDIFLGYDPDDLTHIMYDNYELALQRGEAYNFFDYASYFS